MIMALAERIKECRTNLGFSQAELAERIHVSRQAVTKWESGKGYPDIDNLKAMSCCSMLALTTYLTKSLALLQTRRCVYRLIRKM